MISLLAGKPNADTYPITSLQFTLRDPVTDQEVPIALTEQELARGLQYSGSAGIPEFIDWLFGLQEACHGRKRGEGWDLCFGTGSSDLLYKVVSVPVMQGSRGADIQARRRSFSDCLMKAMWPSSRPPCTRELGPFHLRCGRVNHTVHRRGILPVLHQTRCQVIGKRFSPRVELWTIV